MLDVPAPVVGKALVTRIDVTIDFPGVRIGDYVFERTNAPYRTPISFKGEIQTLYLGKPTAGQACVYDKAAEQGQPDVTSTRIEVHCRPKRCASDLFTLPNPLKM